MKKGKKTKKSVGHPRPKPRGRGGKMILHGHRRQVANMALSADGSRIASVDWIGDLCVWEPWNKELLNSVNAHTNRAQGVGFFAEDTRIITSAWDGAIKVWDAESLELIQEHQGLEQVQFQTNWFWRLKISMDSKWLIVDYQYQGEYGSFLFPIRDDLIDFEDKKNLSGDKKGYFIQFSRKQNNYAYFYDNKENLIIRDIKTNRLKKTIGLRFPRGSMAYTSYTVISHDETKLAVPISLGKRDAYVVRLISLPDGKVLQNFPVSYIELAHMSFSPDDKKLAAVIGFESVYLWDLETGKELLSGAKHRSGSACQFTLDCSTLITSGWDRKVRLWDLDYLAPER